MKSRQYERKQIPMRWPYFIDITCMQQSDIDLLRLVPEDELSVR